MFESWETLESMGSVVVPLEGNLGILLHLNLQHLEPVIGEALRYLSEWLASDHFHQITVPGVDGWLLVQKTVTGAWLARPTVTSSSPAQGSGTMRSDVKAEVNGR
jgi:hypothetical protein